eukprot:scaffold7647_cov403-Prasinococcus_capsulatus_cf.AAC.8
MDKDMFAIHFKGGEKQKLIDSWHYVREAAVSPSESSEKTARFASLNPLTIGTRSCGAPKAVT